PRPRRGRAGLGNPRVSRSGADLTAGQKGSNREPRASVLKFKGRGLGNPPSPPNYFLYSFRNCARLYPTTMRPTPSEFVQLMFMHRVLAGAQCRVASTVATSPWRSIMTRLSILGILIIAALLSAAPFSLQWSQKNVALSLDSADARVGRPLTATSVAGVHRRAHRRAYRHGHYYYYYY